MGNEDDLLRERILKLMLKEGLTNRKFAIILNRNPSNLSQIFKGKRHIPRKMLNEIVETFPKVRKEWLLFGEGDMYFRDEKTEDYQYNTKPRLPKTIYEGHLDDYIKGSKRSLCQEIPIVTQFPNYDFTYLLKDDTMNPKYERDDELAFKGVRFIEWGNDYLLDTEDGPLFKKIYEEDDCIRCVSYKREDYPDILIPKKIIIGYFKCVGLLRL